QARAQQIDPLAGHFHPKGKAPSKFTLEVLDQAKGSLPFGDKRDFEEHAKGLIAPMKDLKIMADAGHVAWDMERFQFLNSQDEFVSLHPSLLPQSRFTTNYGLYEQASIRFAGLTFPTSRSCGARPAGLFSIHW